jgi:hypothetical protein
MSIRVKRRLIIVINGDGAATSVKIDLREQSEGASIVGGFSPSGVDYSAISANGTSPAPPAINSATIANFILTVNFAAALPNGSGAGNGYTLDVGLLIDGAV